MANFEKKNWINRQSQYPNRRKLVETEFENTYEIERAEGEVTEPGNAFDADNMNELETRIANGFNLLEDKDIKITDDSNIFTGNTLDKVLIEIFMYAVNGKTLIANAIGGIANSGTFKQIADRITAVKNSYGATINSLKNEISESKRIIAVRLGKVSADSSFSALGDVLWDIRRNLANGMPDYVDAMDNKSLLELSQYVKQNMKNFYEGSVSAGTGEVTVSGGSTKTVHVSCNFGFKPILVFADNINVRIHTGSNQGIYNQACISNKSFSARTNIKNVTKDGFDICFTSSAYYSVSYTTGGKINFYAIG